MANNHIIKVFHDLTISVKHLANDGIKLPDKTCETLKAPIRPSIYVLSNSVQQFVKNENT